jgi:hypothetical protein
MPAEHEEAARKIYAFMEELRESHVSIPREYDTPMCGECLEEWPCSTILMLDHYQEIMGVVTFLRNPVLDFAEEMEKRLRENDEKGGWRIDTPEYDSLRHFIRSIDNHFYKLRDILGVWPYTEEALDAMIRRSAHIANFAMMIADNAAHWKELLKSGSATAADEGDPDAPE